MQRRVLMLPDRADDILILRRLHDGHDTSADARTAIELHQPRL